MESTNMDLSGAISRLERNLKTFLYEADGAYVENLLRLGKTEIEAQRLAVWDWPHGIGLYGIYKHYLVNKDETILDYLETWFDERIAFGLPEKTVNTAAPLLTLAFLHTHRPKDRYKTIMLEWGDWILHSMPRTPEDGLQHRHAELENKGELWDDTLMMTVLFLAKAGVIFDLPSYRDEAVYQVLLHLFYLVDVQSGLFYHAWSFERMDNFAKALWGRGNGWLTIFIPDFLEVLDVEPAVRKFIVTRFVRQLESLAEHQDESGLWHTLINDPDSYLEASGSAGFCYGFYKAIEAGYLDKQYLDVANKALKAIVERIDEAGCLRDVSYGTNVGTTLDHYRKIPLRSMQYGQGMALLALAAKTNG